MKNKLRNKLNIILVLLLVFSCATRKVDKSIHPGGMTVDWAKDLDRPIPKIEKGALNNQYGPFCVDDKKSFGEVKAKKTHKVTTYVFGPGGYRSLALIPFLKKINYFQGGAFKPNIVLGHGVSSIVAAYYAFGFKADYIEWKFFRFIRKVKDKDAFSLSWIHILEEELLSEFKSKNIEDSKLTLIIPVYNKGTSKVRFLRRGPLKKALLQNVTMYSKHTKPAFTKKLVNESLIEKLGGDQIYLFDLVSKGISWRKGSGDLNGIYEKAASRVNLYKEKNEDLVLDFNFSKVELDNVDQISDLMFESKKRSEQLINEKIAKLAQ
jgi:hypothetical protein